MPDLRERRTSHGLLVPALHHQGVHGTRTSLRTGQQLSSAHHIDDLLVAVAVVRLQSVAIDLPQHHTERPDVTFGGKLPVQDGLGWHPTDRKQRFRLDPEKYNSLPSILPSNTLSNLPIIIRAVNVPRQSKIRNLHRQALTHQAVTCRQIAVHVMMTRQILHPIANLL